MIFKKGKKMNNYHQIENIRFEDDILYIIIDGREYSFIIADISKRLFNASDLERNSYIISPSGYGIHWPIIDEDLSIDGLLGIKHSPTKKNRKISVNS
jgi:hypothetical protein